MPPDLTLHDSFSATLTTNDQGQTGREFTRHWILDNLWGYGDAEARALSLAPDNFSGHKRTRLDITPLGNGYWDVVAGYKTPEAATNDNNNNNNDSPAIANSLSLDTSGATEHITQGRWYEGENGEPRIENGKARDGETAPFFEGAINCSGDSVQGVDVTVPAFNFTEVWTWPAASLTTDYYAELYQLTGSVNRDPWRVFQGGEVLFLGARFDRNRGDDFIAVTYQFSARPNVTNLSVGAINGINKLGWQYLWVKYEDAEETEFLVKRPKAVYINEVYPRTDFTRLKIGNPFPSLTPPASSTGPTGLFGPSTPPPPSWSY